ncbi:hypothetical protein MNEG_14581 [Monoraphidium neglectum]|uniref:Uncharacterized protein n=1 Tax=Monoraphidium neglectum TaxID=145388 RepID=A0A0D2LUT2_9CHLO|nr:hypothetical protein MNEG_14581 [Monoraphidium neglectum]KIY93381.1 hypothetical protein MNEG_14581 [Monoraphidium neglectum]|eukprot:XP_013892401.1 hypothetical protein MNEG_14581 [Monoraphidium neglectum]
MAWFLPRFGQVLEDPESAWSDWQSEYTAVVSGFDQLSGADCMVEAFPSVGLAVVSAPDPLHYYAIFSHTIGSDVVLTVYDDRRYEVECKYTQTVVVASRPVFPRLDMAPLAAALNALETDMPQHVAWSCSRFTDSGPLLRLNALGETLTKAQRYGHPTDRPFYSSSIPPTKLAAVVRSFLAFGLSAAPPPRRGGFEWSELHEINAHIPWESWSRAISEQNGSGHLEANVFESERALARRRQSGGLACGSRTPPAGSAASHSRTGPFAAAAPAQGGGEKGVGGGFAGGAVELGQRAAARRPAAASPLPPVPSGAPWPQAPSEAGRSQAAGPGPLGRVLSAGALSAGSGGGGGAARPGPAVANASLRAQGPAFVLPHSSSRPALALPAGGAAPPMSQPSTLLSEAEVASIAAGGLAVSTSGDA